MRLTGRIIDRSSGTSNVFAVALHITLLEIRGESVQVLIIRQKRVSLGFVEIVIPDTEHSQDDRSLS